MVGGNGNQRLTAFPTKYDGDLSERELAEPALIVMAQLSGQMNDQADRSNDEKHRENDEIDHWPIMPAPQCQRNTTKVVRTRCQL